MPDNTPKSMVLLKQTHGSFS